MRSPSGSSPTSSGSGLPACCGGSAASEACGRGGPELPTCGCGAPSQAPSAEGGARVWLGRRLPLLLLGGLLYTQLEPLAKAFTTSVLGLPLSSRLGSAVAFFVYDAPKVLMLLFAITFLVGFLQSFLDPARTRAVLARRGGLWGNVLAGLFGIATPFCSCSAVPLFTGFVRAGVPLGVTLSYLVAAPMVNEVALVLLLAMFGWKIALFYAATGVSVAVLSGWVLGRLGMERHVEPWALQGAAQAAEAAGGRSLETRLGEALAGAKALTLKAWPHVLVGIGVGAFLHGYIPEALLAKIAGKGAWWNVPLVVAIGVPLYASTATVLPIVQAMLAKGAALGTVLAFMMAVTALSLPEIIILRRVLKVKLIAVFLGVVAVGILGVGWLFNLCF